MLVWGELANVLAEVVIGQHGDRARGLGTILGVWVTLEGAIVRWIYKGVLFASVLMED